MAGFLDNLLAGLQASASGMQPPVGGADIPVIGRRSRGGMSAPVGDQIPLNLGNRSILEEAQQAAENAPQRKGMFGTKGTLRDILGTLGDAFLVQSGNKAIYAPQRQQERRSDALVGFAQSPQEARAAIERLANVDPEAAQELFKQFQTSELAKAQAARQQGNLERQERRDVSANQYKKIQIAQNMMGAADTAEKQAAVRQWLEDPNSDFDNLPVDVFSAGGINRYQQGMLPLQERRTAATESQARSSAIRAARPPAGKAPSPRTATQVDAEILDAVAKGTATPRQQQIYEDRLKRGGGKRKRGSLEGLPVPPSFRR